MTSDPILYIPGIATGLIWGFSTCLYRWIKLDYAVLNWWRLLTALAVATLLALVLGIELTPGVLWAAVNGLVVLGLADTLFMRSLKLAGVAIVAPIAFSYIALTQAFTTLLGEEVRLGKILGALLAVAGIVVLYARARMEKNPRVVFGAVLAVVVCVMWTLGNLVLKFATATTPLHMIVLIRTLVGAVTLSLAGRAFGLLRGVLGVNKREVAKLAVISTADIVAGAYLFVYSISTIGLTMTVILIAPAPVLAQLLATVVVREKLRVQHVVGGLLTVSGIATAVTL